MRGRSRSSSATISPTRTASKPPPGSAARACWSARCATPPPVIACPMSPPSMSGSPKRWRMPSNATGHEPLADRQLPGFRVDRFDRPLRLGLRAARRWRPGLLRAAGRWRAGDGLLGDRPGGPGLNHAGLLTQHPDPGHHAYGRSGQRHRDHRFLPALLARGPRLSPDQLCADRAPHRLPVSASRFASRPTGVRPPSGRKGPTISAI